jgi:hypothetical protein
MMFSIVTHTFVSLVLGAEGQGTCVSATEQITPAIIA